VLYAALPVLLILATVGQISVGEILLALALCALGTSVLRIRMHLERRGGAVPAAGISTITPRAWHDRESPAYLLAKRAFDVTVAIIVLPLALPVMLLCAAAIAAESRGPIFFRQRRVGRDGRFFAVIKFRTMRSDAGSEWARPGDSRITKTGALLRRTSVDELPQLINVLKGEMSIVGPRPEMVEFAQRFAAEFPSYDQRHVVTPGITGWAQLYGKRNLQPDEVGSILPYDLFYVERASPMLDTAILLKTIAEVLFHRAV
jgi:lipopolysaccharide/colanic/teichoic acid biosynthesis glycosyltransferase